MVSDRFGSPAPIFRVADVRASLAYFVETLGFRIDWDEDDFVSVTRDRCTIFLTSADQSQPRMWVWIGVGDVRALHAELAERGARARGQ